jgi:UDP-2-acetamido-2-deoxy-ribo-hexuluronate aminotransferase
LIEEKITSNTKAIIPVSLFGQPADMDEINEIALRHNLRVIEDAAQSFGAEYKGRKSCNLSTIGCTSFFDRSNKSSKYRVRWNIYLLLHNIFQSILD